MLFAHLPFPWCFLSPLPGGLLGQPRPGSFPLLDLRGPRPAPHNRALIKSHPVPWGPPPLESPRVLHPNILCP